MVFRCPECKAEYEYDDDGLCGEDEPIENGTWVEFRCEDCDRLLRVTVSISIAPFPYEKRSRKAVRNEAEGGGR